MTCCCSGVAAAVDGHFTQKRAAADLAEYRAHGPASTTRLLLAGLANAGPLRGRLLDIGSGIGVLTFELLERGLAGAVGVDLSSAYVATASEEAERRGRNDRTRFVQGDFLDVAGELPTADVVTLDRVVCCYPEYERLLTESARRAVRSFALSYPRGVWYVRMWIGLENLMRRLRGNPFRAFVHSPVAMQYLIRRAGFELAFQGGTWKWCADVYLRRANDGEAASDGYARMGRPDTGLDAVSRGERNGKNAEFIDPKRYAQLVVDHDRVLTF